MSMKHIIVAVVACLMINVSAHAKALPDSFADLAEKLSPAVVNISTTQEVEQRSPLDGFSFKFPPGSPFEHLPDLFEQFRPEGHDGSNGNSPRKRKATSLGSGFIIDPKGYIVTNNHVIEGADEITVLLNDDTSLEAEVIGRDAKTDVALLKVKSSKDLPFVQLGDSDKVRVGDWVVAIGNPFGLGGSVSAGIISARARDINAGPFDDFFQTDAAINRGNSGGPLFNTNGEVIGINTAIFSPSGGNVGIGFALPTNLAKSVIKQLKEHGRTFRGWLGVKIQTVTDDIADSLELDKAKGALVVEVTKDSPADKAGVKAGDVILEYNSQSVEAMKRLPRLVAETKIGTKVKLKVLRQDNTKMLSVTIGELKESESASNQGPRKKLSQSEENKMGEKVLGVRVADLTNDLRQRNDIDESTQGVIVLSVDPDSDAAEKGIRKYDVITMANQKAVKSVKDFKFLISQAERKKRKSVLLLVSRDDNTRFVALSLGD